MREGTARVQDRDVCGAQIAIELQAVGNLKISLSQDNTVGAALYSGTWAFCAFQKATLAVIGRQTILPHLHR